MPLPKAKIKRQQPKALTTVGPHPTINQYITIFPTKFISLKLLRHLEKSNPLTITNVIPRNNNHDQNNPPKPNKTKVTALANTTLLNDSILTKNNDPSRKQLYLKHG